MREEDKRLISAPISIWGMQRSEKGPKNPRPRCPLCKSATYAARIDKDRVKGPRERKRGRPKKSDSKKKTRYSKIGYWCETCEIFYYLDGTPNYKLRLKSKESDD
jgi:hypothetical protein